MPNPPNEHPSDINRLAASIVQETVDHTAPPLETAEKDLAAVTLGCKGGLKGGTARAEKLSAARRSQIAKEAAMARWGDNARISREPRNRHPVAEDDCQKTLAERIARLEAELAEARVALRVIDSLQASPTPARPARTGVSGYLSVEARWPAGAARKTTRSDLLRAAVDSLGDDFSLHDVIAYVEHASGERIANRNVVSAVLGAMKERGEIFMVRKRGGGKHSVFRRIKEKPFSVRKYGS
jgi:hypothetical protein